jgi:hypothetical protein
MRASRLLTVTTVYRRGHGRNEQISHQRPRARACLPAGDRFPHGARIPLFPRLRMENRAAISIDKYLGGIGKLF